ncbi:hypothetical protein C1645_829048 [Glomus cerebriforme]|uniref:Uncharacterized protein n=1 Tax=Glomus cerebriforme TaxID=658196 RepID=A0A397SPQ0_9GLOM|nr:hypothetical protein C1645_829048 [Glomus cerebriforme]
MDKSRGVIGNHKKVHNEVRVEALVIKETDFDAPPEPQKYFLRLSHFRKQDYDEESAMKGLEAKDIAQWEDIHYKAGYNSEKSSHAKVISDLNSVIRAINAIAENWCGYTVKINRKKIGPKEKQVWERSYQINQQPYDSLGFGDKSIPELPPYRPKTDNDVQEFFDSIG